jgi:ABC-type antimicrobial peptide transport system permease subunit
MAYYPYSQQIWYLGNFEVSFSGEPGAIVSAVRQAIKDVNRNLPIAEVAMFSEQVDRSLVQQKLIARLSSIFGLLALLLAAIGLYGVLSNTVSARTKEIGVRLAVGARRGDVIWMVLRQVLSLTALGLAIGVGGVLAMAALIRRALFEVQPADPLTIVVVSVVLGSVTVVAGWLPAWRAGCVDPVKALRDD